MRDLAGKGGLVWYYLATPLFAFLDLGLGLPVRVAGLGDPVHRAIYYAGLVGLAALVAFPSGPSRIRSWPAATSVRPCRWPGS